MQVSSDYAELMTRLPHPLVSAKRLKERLDAGEDITLLDARWVLGGESQHPAYLHGHLPRARWVEFEESLTGTPGAGGEGGRHPMPQMDAFESAMREAGVMNDAPVVVYDASNSLAAARCWWLLRYFGKQDVQVLDGGYDAWVAAGGDIAEGDDGSDSEGNFVATRHNLDVLDAEGAAQFAERHMLIDARAPERFAGHHEPVDPVAGRIPGAINIPALACVGPEGHFLPTDDLAMRFTAKGLPTHKRVGVYCGSGVQAMHLALALEVSGVVDHPAVYVGSWSDWITDPERPVETDAWT